jgi:hypothetical protein
VSSRLRLWPTNTTGLGYCIVFFKSSSTRNDEEPLRLSTKVGAKAADLRVEGEKFQMLECKINRMSVLSKNL